MKTRFATYLPLLAIAGVIVLIDQITKVVVRANLGIGQVYRPDLWLSQYVRIIHLKNYGASGGIFPGLSGVFTLLAALIGLAILVYYPRVPSGERLTRLALAIMFGGAMGNLIDRLYQGYVTDFISVGSFPVLNIADAAISTGSALLVLAVWVQDRRKTPDADPSPTEHPIPNEDRS